MLTLDVALTGFGRVGRTLAQMLLARRERYRLVHGVEVRLTGVCGARAGRVNPNGLAPADLDLPARAGLSGIAFLDAAQPQVLFEAGPSDFRTGGPGLVYLQAALARGIDVIAISKGALAFDFPGLQALASSHGAALRFSGATASALPTIDLLQHDLAGCSILALEGILTGTANFILSAMLDDGVSLDAALAEAQRLGIAEPDPALDIDGWDTACKLVILANAALGTHLDVPTLPRDGIRSVTPEAISTWRARGLTPRLVGRIARSDGGWTAGVGVTLYEAGHPFARVHGRSKAIRVATDLMGECTVIGGRSDLNATAAAALKDFEHVLAARRHGPAGHLAP